ncbi:hypothetical protein G6O67_005933 [Ophiocordyceps sinensis]|uniref:Peptide hydrolase n=1 Tax=Ophiocordyceps sinensis TaxID=72228 RepID=A0A8H4LYH5_9HYPO|nr:hypothetical protein G6O67_005933 [Ophiocordyceps sinensis]
MRFNAALVLVGSWSCPRLTHAAPDVRLVTASESDPGQWVTEKQMFQRFISNKIGFVDITGREQDVKPVLAPRQAVSYPSKAEHRDEAERLVSQVNVSRPQSWLRTLTNFHTRHYRSPSGKQAAVWLFDEAKSVASANPVINVTQFSHSWHQPSVIARIPGNSSNLVIVGAHFDSTGGSVEARSPGADDNGSGTVVLLEALRIFAETAYKPENTLEFHFYAAEEAGLRGSMDIFSEYKSEGKRVLAMLNQDMTGYSTSNRSSVITDYVDATLAEYVRTIATAYLDMPPTSTRCGYGCSDHYSALRNGFPSAILASDEFEKADPNIHSPDDTLDRIQWPTLLRHAKFVVGFLVEASNIGHGQSTP